ncbi:DUF6776 family protein [Chitinimonas sp.]|uniref:DUF6776 family protein n=1 Tax=Chitinimonas sp. TaxID=1934313 RepID=UPI0035B261BE
MIGRWKRRGNHLATAKLAVRRHLPWYARFAAALAAAALLVGGTYAAYGYGLTQGKQDPTAARLVQGASRDVAVLSRDLADARQRLGALEQQLRVEQTTRETLSHQLQQLQSDNGSLRDKITFYESLLTKTDRAPSLAIEELRVEPLSGGHYRLRAILVQGQSSQSAFKGSADFRLIIERAGKRSELIWPAQRIPLTVTRFTRIERETELPNDARLRQVEIRIYTQADNRVRLSRTYDVKG